MVNSKARKATSMEDILYELKKENQLLHALLRDRKGFSASETKPIGTSGGISGAAGPSGALKTEGDTMIGPIAFFPDLVSIDAVDDSINISKDAQIAYTSRAIVSAAAASTLETIHGAGFAGQILIIQGILTETFTIVQTGNIRTFDGNDITIVDNQNIWLVFDSIANEWAAIGGSGTGGGTGLHISADLVADQTANVAINNHIQFDRNAPPTGIDGGIVLQTGVGQANGIFELEADKTYFLSGVGSPIKSASVGVLVAWYDRTNAVELGRRVLYDESNAAFRDNQPKAEIIFTPATDVDVDLRIVAFVGTAANLTGWFAISTYAHILEFSGQTGSRGADGSNTLKIPVRACAIGDIASLAAFTVLQDGVTLIEGDRVLLTQQTTQSENGIYDVGVVAAGLAPLVRSIDLNTSTELIASIFVAVEEGTTKANSLWQLTSNNPMTIGVTAQVWSLFSPGISGGPDLGGGSDGIDAAGEFVNDGRLATGKHITKRWEAGVNSSAADNGVNDVIWIPSINNLKGRLVAIGDSNLTNPVAYSDDLGDTWTTSALSGNYNWVRSAYDPVGDILVSVNTDAPGTTTVKRYSTDKGANYIAITSPNTDNHWDIIWSPVDSLFVATCFSTPAAAGQIRGIQTSPDGITWTVRVTPAPTLGFWKYISYSTVEGVYVCTQGGGAVDVMTSPDAITWTLKTLIINGDTEIGTHLRVIYSEGQNKFVAIGARRLGSGLEVTTWISVDGIEWTHHNVDTFTSGVAAIQDVIWAPDLSLFVAVGGTTQTSNNGAPKIWTSPDAITWTRVPVGIDYTNFSTFQGITYAAEYGQFVAVTGTSNITPFRTFR